MIRSDISGFEFTIFGYTVEVVTVCRIPRTIALWHGSRFIYRKG